MEKVFKKKKKAKKVRRTVADALKFAWQQNLPARLSLAAQHPRG